MDLHLGVKPFTPPASGTVCMIGNFDGVHRGHQAIAARGRAHADQLGAPLVGITFEPPPLAVLRPHQAPARLTTLHEKAALLEHAGLDTLIVLDSAPEFLQLTPHAFFEWLMQHVQPRLMVEGPTFCFGRDRAGDVETLRALGAAHHVDVVIVDRVRVNELDGAPYANSSAVRARLENGDVDAARFMLGRPHRLAGIVGRGAGRGDPLGIPTVNLNEIANLIPGDGVYAAALQLPDGGLRLAGANIGGQPTFGGEARRIEAHALDYTGDLRDQRVGLHLFSRLRSQERFSEVNLLLQQIRRDLERVASFKPVLERLASAPLTPL